MGLYPSVYVHSISFDSYVTEVLCGILSSFESYVGAEIPIVSVFSILRHKLLFIYGFLVVCLSRIAQFTNLCLVNISRSIHREVRKNNLGNIISSFTAPALISLALHTTVHATNSLARRQRREELSITI